MSLQAIIKAVDSARKDRYILKVGIFGSFARGEANADSDIDIILEYDNSHEDFLESIDDFMEDIERHISTKIDYVTLNALMRDKKPNEFRDEVLRDVQWIYQA